MSPSCNRCHVPLMQQMPCPARATDGRKSHCTSAGCLLLTMAIPPCATVVGKSHCTSTVHLLLTTAISPSHNSRW
ncbi:hypothetical protein FB451DRAFT_1557266 [Mycena latifolia]|nr:hypothetical protein FB451DRAFT_1557266 [Mycena latifolia]